VRFLEGKDLPREKDADDDKCGKQELKRAVLCKVFHMLLQYADKKIADTRSPKEIKA
jgi:hypothetical protein